MVSFLKKGILVSLFMLCVFFAGPAFGAVTGITIDLQNLGLEIGQTGTLVATVIAEDADDKTFTWASDHPEIATINQNGQVTAFKTGGAVITATTNTGGFVASSYVSVSAPTIPVRGISLDKTALILGMGETYTLIPSFSPTDASGKHVTWESSNASVAAVDITANTQHAADPAANEGADDSDDDVEEDALLAIGLHDHAGDPTGEAANNDPRDYFPYKVHDVSTSLVVLFRFHLPVLPAYAQLHRHCS